jgi:hypothetical protein
MYLRPQTPFVIDKSLRELGLWKQKSGDTKTDQQLLLKNGGSLQEKSVAENAASKTDVAVWN